MLGYYEDLKNKALVSSKMARKKPLVGIVINSHWPPEQHPPNKEGEFFAGALKSDFSITLNVNFWELFFLFLIKLNWWAGW